MLVFLNIEYSHYIHTDATVINQGHHKIVFYDCMHRVDLST